MRTQEEVVERYEERKDADMFGFETDEYLMRMDWERAQTYLVDDATSEDWPVPEDALERDKILERMKGYMKFARKKADNERGLSAKRSIAHYIAWIWLLGDDGFLAELEREYDGSEDYGKSTLRMIEAHCDF